MRPRCIVVMSLLLGLIIWSTSAGAGQSLPIERPTCASAPVMTLQSQPWQTPAQILLFDMKGLESGALELRVVVDEIERLTERIQVDQSFVDHEGSPVVEILGHHPEIRRELYELGLRPEARVRVEAWSNGQLLQTFTVREAIVATARLLANGFEPFVLDSEIAGAAPDKPGADRVARDLSKTTNCDYCWDWYETCVETGCDGVPPRICEREIESCKADRDACLADCVCTYEVETTYGPWEHVSTVWGGPSYDGCVSVYSSCGGFYDYWPQLYDGYIKQWRREVTTVTTYTDCTTSTDVTYEYSSATCWEMHPTCWLCVNPNPYGLPNCNQVNP